MKKKDPDDFAKNMRAFARQHGPGWQEKYKDNLVKTCEIMIEQGMCTREQAIADLVELEAKLKEAQHEAHVLDWVREVRERLKANESRQRRPQ